MSSLKQSIRVGLLAALILSCEGGEADAQYHPHTTPMHQQHWFMHQQHEAMQAHHAWMMAQYQVWLMAQHQAWLMAQHEAALRMHQHRAHEAAQQHRATLRSDGGSTTISPNDHSKKQTTVPRTDLSGSGYITISPNDPSKNRAEWASGTHAKPMTYPTDPAREFERQAARLAEEVSHSSGARRAEILNTLRDTKGAVYTDAILRLANELKGEAQTQVREALARRLTRMTLATLREMLTDEEREIRLASATACGLKMDRQYVPELILLLADKDALVVRAAHASLKRLTGTDFGPEPDADNGEKTRAILAWRNWWKMQMK